MKNKSINKSNFFGNENKKKNVMKLIVMKLENILHLNLQIVLRNMFSVLNIYNYIIKDGIILQENLRRKYMIFKRMIFLKENQPDHFLTVQPLKFSFNFAIFLINKKLILEKKEKDLKIIKIIVLMNKSKMHWKLWI